MESPWPPDVPWSLWLYKTLTPSEIAQVPMMGVKFAPEFLYAFAFGCFFIVFFAWKRFAGRSEEITFASEALSALQANNLGSRNAIVRAYIIYAGAILILYICLTFFGKLILQASTIVQTAGVTVDTSELKFDSFEWPLTLAFAFAGFADLLPPVRLAESWLRNRAYRAAGIPVRLEQTTRSLIATLEDASTRGGTDDGNPPADEDPLACVLRQHNSGWAAHLDVSTTLKELLERRAARRIELLSLLAQIELLIHWAKTARGKWPGTEVSQKVRSTEEELVRKADEALNRLQMRVTETLRSEYGQHTAEHEPAVLGGAQKERLDSDLTQAIQDLRKLRLDLVSILAIYIERDPDVPEPMHRRADRDATRSDRALAALLSETDRPESAEQGPEAVLLLLLVPTFLLYTIAAWQGVQEPASVYIERTNSFGVLSTALIETLRIASLTWLPLLAAFSVRQFYWDSGDWAGAPRTHSRGSALLQHAGCLALALAVSLVGLTGVALLRAFAIAPDTPNFLSLLFSGAVPFLLYYPSQAVIVVPLVPLCLMAADARARDKAGIGYAIAAAAAVVFVSVRHTYYWDPSLSDRCQFAMALAQVDCFRRLEALGHFLLGVLAFLATWLLGVGRPVVHRAALPGAAVLTIALATLAAPPPAAAQDASNAVVVGFRGDVEPFSYVIEDGQRYAGFIADLCYRIFSGTGYRVDTRLVTAENRFSRLGEVLKPEDVKDGASKRIDVLCDAVTMRFSDPQRKGVYSPIIFASGVSYLDGIARARGSGISIGYVENTTAFQVAAKTCETDYFKALLPAHREALYERCSFSKNAAETLRLIGVSADQKGIEAQVDQLWKSAKSTTLALDKNKNGIAVRDRAKKIVERLTPYCNDESCAPEAMSKLADTDLTDDICTKPAPEETDLTAEQQWLDYHFCPKKSHDALVEWLCTVRDQRRVYMGDREIIQAKLASWQERNGPCVVEVPTGAPYLTYEPYALLIASDRPDLVALVQQRVFHLFSHRDWITAHFQSYFPDLRMSPALAYLFLLNAVEQEADFLVPDKDTEAPAPRGTPGVAAAADTEANVAALVPGLPSVPRPQPRKATMLPP